MKLAFTKMQGIGNDFIVIDGIHQAVNLSVEMIRRMASRDVSGIGCDQILLVEKPLSDNADFKYRIFNADGSEVAQCGNGARCFARFVRDKGLTDKSEIVVDTLARQLTLYVRDDGLITVNMGLPLFLPAEIPLLMSEEALAYSVDVSGETVEFGAVSMGNPHAVIRVEHLDTAPVQTQGKILESHRLFPERVNVGFMQIISDHEIRLRVFERGAGETLACGSGACAAVVSGIERGWLAKNQAVKVQMRGGDLEIRWAGRGTPAWMTGAAVSVFEGQITL